MSTDVDWQAGTAARTITPTEQLWLAGYAARDEPAQGVDQELEATAVALEDGADNRVVVVGADVLGFPRAVSRAIEDRCEREHDLPADALLLGASHTHCGPVLRAERAERLPAEQQELLAAYRERFIDHIVEVVGESLADRSPAAVGHTHARCGFAMNRRTPRPDGIENHPYPDGPVDHTVPVLRIDEPGTDGTEGLRGVVFGYACHNTTLNFYRYGGDWAGYAKEYIREYHPDVTPVFLTGCAGDQNPYPRREEPFVRHHGRAMANAVETALETDARPLAGPLQLARRRVTVDYDGVPDRAELEERLDSESSYVREDAQRLLDRLDEEGELPSTYDIPAGVIRFDPDLTLVTLPGEPVVDYAHRLGEELSGDVWTAGYTIEQPGYVPSARVRREGGYEGERWVTHWSHPAPFAASTEDRLVSTVHELVDGLEQG